MGDVWRDVRVIPTATPDDVEQIATEMEQAGLASELAAVREATRIAPSLPIYEAAKWGYDDWRASDEDRSVFVETCRRLLADRRAGDRGVAE